MAGSFLTVKLMTDERFAEVLFELEQFTHTLRSCSLTEKQAHELMATLHKATCILVSDDDCNDAPDTING